MKAPRLLRSRRFWSSVCLVAVVAAVWVALCLWSRAGDPDRILAEPRGADGRLTKGQVRRLLECDIRDVDGNTRRYNYFQTLTEKPSYHGEFDWAINMLCANRRTDAKVAHEGLGVSKQLIEIALDTQESSMMRSAACMNLRSVDPHGALEAFKEYCKSARPTTLDYHLFRGGLPGAQRINGKAPARYSYQAFVADIATKTVDDIYIERLDEAIADEILESNNVTMVRWLNRYHGVDFDEWLRANAPEVFAFRKRELERGYDPVRNAWLMRDMRAGRVSNVVTDEGLVHSLYKDEGDRAAVRRLLQICADETPRRGEENWCETLRQWYKANRSHLVYDPQVMHFVVGAKAVRPEVSVQSTDAGEMK